MRDYSTVSPRFWLGKTGKQIRAAGVSAQVVALYLMTSPHANMLGLYYLPINYLTHETGIATKVARDALRNLAEIGFGDYDDAAECVWVCEMAKFQIGDQLKQGDKRCAGVQREYLGLPDNRFLKAFFERYSERFHMTICRDETSGSDKPHKTPSEAPSKPLRSQEQEQEQEQEQHRISPSVSKRGKKIALPDDWQPAGKTIDQLSAEFGLRVPEDTDRYVAAFRDTCKAKGYEYIDFDAAFSNCVRQDWPKLRNGARRMQSERRLAV